MPGSAHCSFGRWHHSRAFEAPSSTATTSPDRHQTERQRSRLSVGVVTQCIGVPALVWPVAPSGEQNAPGCTTPSSGGVCTTGAGATVVGGAIVVTIGLGVVVVGVGLTAV